MQSRVLRFLSRWATAVAVATALPGCDSASVEEGAALRSGELDDENESGEPDPANIGDDIDGGVNIGCPECGSHWTIEGRIHAIYLDPDLGESILSLATTGTLALRYGWGSFTEDNIRQDDNGYKGYTIEIPRISSHKPASIDLGTGVLRVQHENVPIFVHLPYVDNKTKLFADPPVFE